MTNGKLDAVIPGGTLGTIKYPPAVDFVATYGKGARLWASDGREFIDFVLGSGPMVLGHAHPRVVAAVQEQAARGTQFFVINDQALKLADLIAQLVPCAEAVKFLADGSEATFYGLRLARAFTGRSLVLKFEGAFHGHQDYGMHGVTPKRRSNYPQALPDSAGIPEGVTATVLVAPYNDLAAATEIALAHAEALAAIIVEPVQRALLPQPGFLAGLRALCDRIGALLVFDEVVTGFRLALGGAQEKFGVTPDLCALGKIVGGGLPLAAIVGRHDIIELTVPNRAEDGKSVYLNGTLNGNPLAAAAGLATIEVLVEENGPARLEASGAKLREALNAAAARLSIPFQMIGPSAFPEPIFGTAPITDYAGHEASNRKAAKQFGLELMKRGIYVHLGSKMYISLAHGGADLEQAAARAFDAMQAVRDGGALE
jgi:glutamate-1-semialdehyde 2,1-aminomutase